jgi:hypothetical protein
VTEALVALAAVVGAGGAAALALEALRPSRDAQRTAVRAAVFYAWASIVAHA